MLFLSFTDIIWSYVNISSNTKLDLRETNLVGLDRDLVLGAMHSDTLPL